jgi:hypothetical protein
MYLMLVVEDGAGGSLGVEGGRDSEKSEAARPLVRAKAAMPRLCPVLDY